MRIGLIGAGSFARRGPLPAIALLPEMELVAIYSRSREASESAAAEWNAKTVCTSVEALLARKDIDVVVVVTPPVTHAALAGAVLEAGKPLIVEKPTTLSAADAGKLQALAESRGIPNAVDHEHRYDPAMVKMADIILTGTIGQLRSTSLSAVTCFANDPAFEAMRYWNFHHSAALGGGMLPQYASHLLDLHLYMFGGLEPMGGYAPAIIPARPTRPTVPGGSDGPLKTVEAEDSAALAARLPGGGACALSLSYVANAMPDFRWAVHGSEGTVIYDGKDGWFGGTLKLATGWQGMPETIPLPKRRREDTMPGMNGWMQDLIAELLLDFAAVLGGSRKKGRYATLADEVTVWRAVEAWRRSSPLPPTGERAGRPAALLPHHRSAGVEMLEQNNRMIPAVNT